MSALLQATEFKTKYRDEMQRRVKAEADIRAVERDARAEVMLAGAEVTAANRYATNLPAAACL